MKIPKEIRIGGEKMRYQTIKKTCGFDGKDKRSIHIYSGLKELASTVNKTIEYDFLANIIILSIMV